MNGCNTRADAYLSRVDTTRGKVGECRFLIRRTGWTVRSNEIGIRPRRGRTDRTTLLSGVDSRALQASLDVGSRGQMNDTNDYSPPVGLGTGFSQRVR